MFSTTLLQTRLAGSFRGTARLATLLALVLFAGYGCSEKTRVVRPAVEADPEVHAVEIQNAPVAMTPGTTVQLEASVSADEGIEDHGVLWSSSSSALLEVGSDGMVTAIAPGTAEVTARAHADATVFDRVRITVTSEEATITGVTISPMTEDLYVGNEATLTASVTGTGSFDPSVAWTSNRPHVASIDAHGVVTAEAPGTVEISALSQMDPTKAAQIVLEVLPAQITEVTLSAPALEMLPGTTQTLNVTVSALGSIDTSVAWSTSDSSIATVDENGTVAAQAIGWVTITAASNADPSRAGSVDIHVDTPDLSGLVQLKNIETSRLLLSAGDPATGEGDEGGWLSSPSVVGADANYYGRAVWQLTKLSDGTYSLKNRETGRYAFDPSDVHTGPDGTEGGWLSSETILGADANYYGRAQWKLEDAGDGRYRFRNAVTNRLLFSTGDPATGAGDEGGWLSSPDVVGADANYYNRAIWEMIR